MIQLATPAAVMPCPAITVQGTCRVQTAPIKILTSRAPQLVDLTSHLRDIVERSGIFAGSAQVFCMHTSAALVLNEDEQLLHRDVEAFLEELASSQRRYQHDDLARRTDKVEPDHGRNAHAHLKQMVLGGSLSVPIVAGHPRLGQFQRVFLVELDRPRPRTVLVQVSGVTNAA